MDGILLADYTEVSMSSSTIIHPLFEECKNFTLDLYWRDIFTKFALNRFPTGIRYDPTHKNLILKINGKKTEVIALPEEDPAFCFQIVMRIMRDKLNMHSTRDIKSGKEELAIDSQKNVCNLDCEWKKIKPRYLKDQLMMDYIAKLKEKYSLTPQEVKHLISIIQLGFQFKGLSQDDVDFSDGAIQDIQGLSFDRKTRKFTVPEYSSCSKTAEKPPNTDKFYPMLKKYLRDDTLRKNKFRYKSSKESSI